MRKLFLHIILLLLFVNVANCQFYFLEDAQSQIKVHFLRHKIEINPDKTFFNALSIKNPSDRAVTFRTNFSYPVSWSFIGEKNKKITLAPGDSILIPFRAAPSINAKGEIGYSIVASLSDLNGNTFKNEYSFVNIPKIKSIKITPLDRVVYIDQYKKISNIKLLFVNNGNTDETFFINYTFDRLTSTQGAVEGIYKQEVTLTPYTDSIVKLPIFVNTNKSDYTKKFHRIGIEINSKDTTYKTSIWAKELENKFYNTIPDKYKFLSIELNFQNLFSEYPMALSFNVTGNMLFKRAGDIHYRLQTMGGAFYTDPWRYGRYYAIYNYKSLRLQVGDVFGDLGQDMFGRGVDMEYLIRKKDKIRLIASSSVYKDRLNFGGAYFVNFKKFGVEFAGTFVQDKTIGADISGGFINTAFGSKAIGDIKLGASATYADWYNINYKNTLGFGGIFQYYNQWNKKTTLAINSRYGERSYLGRYNGRFEFHGQLIHNITGGKYFLAQYNNNSYKPALFYGDSLTPKTYNYYDESKFTYNFYTSAKVLLTFGAISESRAANNFIFSQGNNFELKTRNALGYVGLRIRNRYTNNIFVLWAKLGQTFVTDFTQGIYNEDYVNKNWFSMVLSANYRSRHLGAYMSYYHGPYGINQQYAYFANNLYSKSVRIMPYLDYFLYKNYIRLISHIAYTYDVTVKTSRINVGTDIKGYIGRTWELTFTNTINYSSTVDRITDDRYTYSGTYFEFRIKKDFLFNQPRYQYHNFKVIFFKDLNGNNVKDDKEPGIKDVLLTIKKDDSREMDEEFNTAGFFMPIDLLSDMDGIVKYDNIPNGFYTIEYMPIASIKGAYTSENRQQDIYIGKDQTLYIPFFENNKIFGKAILNRSKLSNLGQISPGNIRVTAEDTHGKKYSALTDDNGNFIIYVPSVDKYKVHINNIFFENFELEQNDYEVQLNGYRQFEVNFIFNEKRRKINFSNSYNYAQHGNEQGVELIRRTNLSGTVKDATTLKPLVATIKIVDNQGNVITSAKSNLKTGLFTLSFVAGDNYHVEINAEGYWYYSEKLYSEQIVTFKNIRKSILLKGITVGQLIPMKTLNFASGSTEIPPTAFPELERLLKVLRKNPTVKITVHGHADDQEILETNTDLAMERAKIVAKYLIANGYNRVRYVGHSNTKPIADNDTEEGRQKNRRVEIEVTGK